MSELFNGSLGVTDIEIEQCLHIKDDRRVAQILHIDAARVARVRAKSRKAARSIAVSGDPIGFDVKSDAGARAGSAALLKAILRYLERHHPRKESANG